MTKPDGYIQRFMSGIEAALLPPVTEQARRLIGKAIDRAYTAGPPARRRTRHGSWP